MFKRLLARLFWSKPKQKATTSAGSGKHGQ